MRRTMMHWKPRGWTLIGMLLMTIPGVMRVMTTPVNAQVSQIATTQVTDTVYLADGSTATGTVIVSWQAFTTAIGQSVPAGSTSAVIGSGGVLSLQLAPNAGATPMGTYYTAVYHLSDGSVSREFWVVPVSQTPVQVSTIESTVLPTSVAMQTVSKSYVDTAIATAISGHPLDDSSPYVIKTGDTMTGPLVLPGDPTTANQAADKHYVDANVTALGGGLGQKVALLPYASQVVVQPAGTQLQVNLLNGDQYASQYVTGLGNNGIANAISSPDCASGCDVKVEHSYVSTENYSAEGLNSGAGGTHVEDDRNGSRRDVYLNPTSTMAPGLDAGQAIDVVSTRNTAAEFASGLGSDDPGSVGVTISHEGLTGGSNLFPATIETVPYFKTNYSALNVTGTYNTMGQHVLEPRGINCYGVGDCLIGSEFLNASGGFRDEADEATHPLDIQVREDTVVFQGTCSQGCTTGATVVTLNPTVASGTQGEGRYLIDLNPANIINTGQIIGGASSANILPGPEVTFSGTNFSLSVFLATAQAATSQVNNVAPGTLTMPIATTGVPAGFATSTAAISNGSGVACVTEPSGLNPQNYEMVKYNVVDGTHLQISFNKVHRAGATIAIGGLCGYGLEETVDTARGIRQVFPVIGSYSATGLYYAGGSTAIVGVNYGTGGYINVSLQIAAIARSGNVVTVTTAGNAPVDLNGLTLNVSGVADASYNGAFSVTTTGANTLTYANSGANSTSTGGSVGIVTGGYALYPMAEVLGVFNATTKKVDGQMTLAPNNVRWAANDLVEQPHYYQEGIAADTTFVSQTIPRATTQLSAGLTYELSAGPGIIGWLINNSVPASNYFGNGGTHGEPGTAFAAQGIWQRTMDVQAGEQSVFSIHCNSHGCGKWNSGYDLFELDNGAGGVDSISFQPTTSALSINLRGAQYGFSPQAFTAGTVNAGIVNATTLNGSMSAASLTSGTIGAARLPVFGASGSGHAVGAVPDPGATGGATRYLREDGTWATPSGSGGGGTAQSTGSTGSAVPTALPGATADYNFLQGSGTVLTDASSNSNNGTLGSGALAPAWTATGLSFSGQQQVALPSSLNGTQTFFLAVYISPLTSGTQPANSYPMLLGGSTGAAGLNLLYAENIGGQYVGAVYSPQIFAAGNPMTSGVTPISGFHVLTYVLGTGSGSLDHLYVDGVEQPSYDRQSASAGAQTSGNLFLGSSDTDVFTGSGFLGTMYRVVTYSGNTLSASQIQSISGSIRNDVQQRGVAVTPQTIPQTRPTLNCIGDSITVGYGAASPYCSMLSLTNQPNYNIVNWGISGITVLAINGSEANRVAPQCKTINGPANALVFAGTNDFGVYATSFYPVFEGLMGEVQTLKAAGCKVFVGTMLSRGGVGGPGTMDSVKDGYDALILTQAKAGGADGVVDFAANPLLGADGAYANATYFNGDQTHPTTVGQGLLASALSNVLNYTNGFNRANPNVVTATTYQMLSGDGAITAAPTANASYTAPDCVGPSGAEYVISNPQSVFTVSVVGMSGEPINGLTTGIVIPANSSVTLHDVANPKTVSGCHWVM